LAKCEILAFRDEEFMSKTSQDDDSLPLPKMPWISVIKRPKIDFRRPNFQISYDAPQKYLLAAILFFIVFILAGGIYNMAEGPLAMGSTETQLVPILRTISDQFLVESFIAGLLILMGAAGIFFVRYSTRFAYDMRNSLVLLTIGSVMLLSAIIGITVMYNFKAGL
jgi:hypothetical protein